MKNQVYQRGAIFMSKSVHLAGWGNSVALRIPKSILTQLGLNKDSVVTVSAVNNEIIVKPCRTHTPLAERFANFSGDCREEEIDWGPDVGTEVLDD
jgi:antitoxin MazE